MPKSFVFTILFIVSVVNFHCVRSSRQVENPLAWKKIHLDFQGIDANGLRGRPDGKVAVDYEFCIPADKKKWKIVRKIDTTATLQPGSAGRIGCTKTQWLVIGHTNQARYLRVLYDLATLPFVERIEETHWE